MTDAETTALVERARLSMTLVLIAASREVEAARGSDHRYAEAADAIRRIAGTMDQVSDDVLLKLVTVNQSKGPLSTLDRDAALSEVGGALPVYEDAKAFFQSLVEQVDQILSRARRHTCTDRTISSALMAAVRLHGAVEVGALSSGHDRAPSLRLHRTVPAVKGGADRPALGS